MLGTLGSFALMSEESLARLLIAGDLTEDAVTMAVQLGVFPGDKLTGTPSKTKGYTWSDWETLRDTINKGGATGGKMDEQEVLTLLTGYTDRDWDMLAAWTTCRVKRSAVVAGALRSHAFKADDAKKAGAVPPFAANQKANKGAQVALGALEFVSRGLDRLEALWPSAKPGSGGRLSYNEAVKDLQPGLTVAGVINWSLGIHGDAVEVEKFVGEYITLDYPGADLKFVLGEIAWWYKQVGLPLPAPEDSWELLKSFCPHTVAEAMHDQQESPLGAEIVRLDPFSLKTGDRGAKIVWGFKQPVVPNIIALPHPSRGGDLSKSPYQIFDARDQQLKLIKIQLEPPSSLTARGIELEFSKNLLTENEYRLLLAEAEERGSKALKVAVALGDVGGVGNVLREKSVTQSAAEEAKLGAVREKDTQMVRGVGSTVGGTMKKAGPVGSALLVLGILAVFVGTPIFLSYKNLVLDAPARGMFAQPDKVLQNATSGMMVFALLAVLFIWKGLPILRGFLSSMRRSLTGK